MQKIRVEDAIGRVLCHDLTRIVKGEFKGPQFRKGHVIQAEDMGMLLSMGKEHVFVWEDRAGMLHENDAAARLCALCRDENMSAGPVSEGKIELAADIDGLFCVDAQRLQAVNMVESIAIASRHSMSPVRRGEKLAGMRVIPLMIDGSLIAEAERRAGTGPLFSLMPYTAESACIITTGSEVARGIIKDTFTPVVEAKLAAYGISVVKRFVVDDGPENIVRAIAEAREASPDMLLCTGGMSVDPDDNTPGAIRASGASIVSYGAPVLPGALFLLGYYAEGTAVMGLPACVMYAGATVFDLVLPRVAAGLRLCKEDFARMGNGGLCLSCKPCTYPVCPFGKTA